MLEVKRRSAGIWEEFGETSNFIFSVNNMPFLTVGKFRRDEANFYHRTRWPTTLAMAEGIEFILQAQSRLMMQWLPPEARHTAASLQIEANIPLEDPTFAASIFKKPLEGFDLYVMSVNLTDEFGGASFKYGRKNIQEIKHPFEQDTYLEISSRFNLTDFIIEMLTVSCAVENLPLEDVRKRLNRIYRNYPKP